ncbi:MAG: VOC family protein, partial [Verrucomicrobiota bacterium]
MAPDSTATNSSACTIAPWLSVQGSAKAVEFYKRALGAIEAYRLEDPSGGVVARLSVGGAEFWVSDESPEHGNPSPGSGSGVAVRMILTVADPDAAFAQAIKAGATEVYPVTEGHGWRVGRLVDPFGHHWEIGRQVGVEEPRSGIETDQKKADPAAGKDDLHPAANEGKTALLFLKFSRHKLLEQYWVRLRACVEPLTAEQVWWRPNAASNSIGNLILHLNGNVRQWLVDSFNRTQDERNRPAEFSAEDGLSAAQLLEKLGVTMQEADRVLVRLTESDL